MTDNTYELSRANRQTVLTTCVRFDHSDLPASAVAGAGVFVDMPPGHIVLRCTIVVIAVGTGGTSQTIDVGTVADDDGYGADLVVTAVAGVLGSGALLREYQAAAVEIHASDGTGTAATAAAEYLMIIEYVQVDRSNEVFG